MNKSILLIKALLLCICFANNALATPAACYYRSIQNWNQDGTFKNNRLNSYVTDELLTIEYGIRRDDGEAIDGNVIDTVRQAVADCGCTVYGDWGQYDYSHGISGICGKA